MRINVVIDDELMKSALELSGLRTKRESIEEGLRLLVQHNHQLKIKEFRGKLKWHGNLEKVRRD
ncbi:MAG TPA: type II toxin-antitoxin system VapB family antitoxin [Dissulfurispiraceae bacterium]